jgi:ABC-type Fe3+ transport system substrate-binding protein
MPRRELKSGKQVADWLAEIGSQLKKPGNMTLIGSAALLWHAHEKGLVTELPESSMDVDPVTDSDEVAKLCYEALIGSEFERVHGWHVNLMPNTVLLELPSGWQERAAKKQIGKLELAVPAPADLLAPKLKRNQPRDQVHAEWAKRIGLLK